MVPGYVILENFYLKVLVLFKLGNKGPFKKFGIITILVPKFSEYYKLVLGLIQFQNKKIK